jgi:hypothetical protein
MSAAAKKNVSSYWNTYSYNQMEQSTTVLRHNPSAENRYQGTSVPSGSL